MSFIELLVFVGLLLEFGNEAFGVADAAVKFEEAGLFYHFLRGVTKTISKERIKLDTFMNRRLRMLGIPPFVAQER